VSVFFWLVVRLSITALVLATLAVAVACDDGEAESDKIQVVTTLPLFADMIENVGGDRVEVTALLPSGADPHTWEPSPQDAKKVSEADIIFANGLELEPAALGFIEANAPSDVPVVKIGGKSPFLATESSLTLLDEYEFDPEFVSNGADPHLWLHPRNAIVYSEVFRNMLTGVDPMGVDIYQANYQAYASSLEELEQPEHCVLRSRRSWRPGQGPRLVRMTSRSSSQRWRNRISRQFSWSRRLIPRARLWRRLPRIPVRRSARCTATPWTMK
jgi:ABC-type Zn uptake system ZnuABC Zn-binding protein ZnuA